MNDATTTKTIALDRRVAAAIAIAASLGTRVERRAKESRGHRLAAGREHAKQAKALRGKLELNYDPSSGRYRSTDYSVGGYGG